MCFKIDDMMQDEEELQTCALYFAIKCLKPNSRISPIDAKTALSGFSEVDFLISIAVISLF
jgi:hypothetical protein